MNVDKKIIELFEELLELGRKVLATRRAPPPNVMTSDFVDVQLANQWMTSCQSLLSKVFGEGSAHYRRLSSLFPDYPKWNHVSQAFGVLQAAIADYSRGALFDLKRQVEADVFDDFLEQAEHLFALGYFQPAAVLAGCVLEDALRRLCEENGVPLSEKPKLDSMNAQLAKQGAYNKLMQKRITALADLRNSAAHGKWDAFDDTDVEAMIRDVRTFLEKHYS